MAFSSNITIYTQSAHVTQQLTKSTLRVALPKTVVAQSIIVLNDKKQVEPFTYVTPLSMAQRVNNSAVVAQVFKDGHTWTGVLEYVTDDVVTLYDSEMEHRIIVRNYSALVVNEENSETSHLSYVAFDSPKTQTLSYLQTGVSWTPYATVILNSRKNTAFLRLSAQIKNAGGLNLDGDISLVAGNIYQPSAAYATDEFEESLRPTAAARRATSSMVMMKQSSRLPSASYSDMKSEGQQRLEDFVRFPLGLRNIAQQEIVELFCVDIVPKKVYKHRISSYESEGVYFGYRFLTPRFLPACETHVYTSSPPQNVIERYLGQCCIREKQPNQKTTLMIGRSTLIRVRSHVEEVATKEGQRIRGMPNKEIVSWEIINTSPDQPSGEVIVKYNLQSRQISKIVNNNTTSGKDRIIPEQKRDNLVWRFKELQPLTTVKFNYTVLFAVDEL